MKLLDPVERTPDQVVQDFASPEIEYQRAPFRVFATPRVSVFVQRRAVEPHEAMLVSRKMGGHPVEDDADAFLVAPVDEVTQVVGLAEAPGGGVETDRLITPGTVERVFGYGQKLDVCETHLADVWHQLVGQFAVSEPAIGIFGPASP